MITDTRPVQQLDRDGRDEIYLSNESSGYQISNWIYDIQSIESIATFEVGQ